MPLSEAIAFGALGGLIVEFVCMWGYIISWQAARRECMESGVIPLPGIAKYLDLPADTFVTVTRVAMGAVMGFLLCDQVAGPMAAISVGAAAPALLRQLNGARTLDDLRGSANRGVEDEISNGR
ncbi:hypothetical protein ACFYXJ_09975 [Streptomyces sp. NPDC002667]|uniref:hypothetical protein n=1 Tax=Streptomyces sp. NPDC002667 TaxID=3364657 RepID=UPI0036974473